ncbi:MAG: lipoprotein [Betaproteobacteria bacterium]|jgi:predicted small lipoprotein YifL|nr:MAG: lipoprotein [Betaproteobacteria bacterium]
MRYTTLILALTLITGCGSKGPLYLPEKAPTQTRSAEDAGVQDTSTREEEEDSTP